MRNARQDVFARQAEAGHHVDRRVDRQGPRLYSFKGVDNAFQDFPIEECRPTKALARRFQATCELQFLLAIEQRDGAHLPEIKTQSVIRGVGSVGPTCLSRTFVVVVRVVGLVGIMECVEGPIGIRKPRCELVVGPTLWIVGNVRVIEFFTWAAFGLP